MIKDLKIQNFIEELSSSSTTPGGGAAAALVGGVAAGLCEMVANLTIGKEKYKDVENKIEKYKIEIISLKERLLNLSDEDVEAFKNVMIAYKISKEDSSRDSQIENSLKEATEIPLETVKICNRVMEIAEGLIKIGNKNAISDAKSALHLARGAKLSALENVLINLNSIKDKAWKENIESKVVAIKKM